MNTIIRHIEYLLSRTDCVIVPNLGAFLAHYQNARIDAEGMVIVPPKRVFTFNSALTHNDGTLACSISRSLGISYEAALDKLYHEVQTMQQHLHNNGELVIGRIGQLIYYGETDTVQFFPASAEAISPYFNFLPTVTIDEEKPEVSLQEETMDETPRVSPWPRIVRLAASIALLLIIGFVASTPIKVDDAALAALYPELRQMTVDEILPASPDTIGTITAYVSDKSMLTIDVDSVMKSWKAAEGNYMIVVGSFCDREEAQRFIASHPEADLSIQESPNRCRVYAGSYNDEIEAYRALKASPFATKGAWVCKK